MKCDRAPFGVHVPLVDVRGAPTGRCKFCGASMLEGVRDGITFDRPRDFVRLNAQMQRVFDVMADGRAHTPTELEELTGYNWASLSARLRDLRKPKFGGYTVIRESLGGGLFTYRLAVGAAAERGA